MKRNRLKLYSLYTPSQKKIKDEWFLKTMRDDYEIFFEVCAVEDGGAFVDPVGGPPVIQKVDLVIRAIQENWGNVFIFSDVDVQFFQPTEPILVPMMESLDWVMLRDSMDGRMCPGFFACRANEKTLAFWKDVRTYLDRHLEETDEEALNHLWVSKSDGLMRLFLYFGEWGAKIPVGRKWISRLMVLGKPKWKNAYDIRWNFLPDTFLSLGILGHSAWKPGMMIKAPDKIVLHHANGIEPGLSHKLTCLRHVREIVARRDYVRG
ncbi:MAG: hypothetical protein JW893_05650 [Candidatus Omnitrophica bacterium]|nr:hypothetical protein [Candidatus Omnitrophota bacterium]